MDAEGAVWLADSHHSCAVRVLDGGQVTHIIETAPSECIACVLGGPDRRTLFLVLAPPRDAPGNDQLVLGGPAARSRDGRVEAIRVDVPGAGWP